MPVVRIEWKKDDKTKNRKTELMDFIAKSINKATGTDVGNVYEIIYDIEPENLRRSGTVINIDWAAVPSRTKESKKQIMAEVTEKVSEITGESKSGIVITFNDLPLTNVALGGIARG